MLAARIRGLIDAELPAGLGRLARFAKAYRETVRVMIADPERRRRLWHRVFDGDIAALLAHGAETRARLRMLRLINGAAEPALPPGTVYLIGSGPGDPDLLTLRALRLLKRADTIVHDLDIGDDILALARRDAERIEVAPKAAACLRLGSEIDQLLYALVRPGVVVVRLVAGDPALSGHGQRATEYLLSHGIDVELVAGIATSTQALGGNNFARGEKRDGTSRRNGK